MEKEAGSGVARVTVVHAEACHFCEDAYRALTDIAAERPIDIEMIAADSEAGRALFNLHRPAMYPLVLVDGSYFSAGRLPRKKLLAALDVRTRARESLTAGQA